MKRALVTAALAAVAPLALSQGKSDAPTPAANPVQACVACHGAQGEGNPAGGFPRIAGQSERYLLHQLQSYANGSRRNSVMEPIAKGLTPAARAAAAQYYARAQPPAASQASTAGTSTGGTHERGELLADRGDDARQLQGCNNCHGPGGTGEAPAIPYVTGLDAKYIAAQLEAFRSGTRRNDAGQQMRMVARQLAPADVDAVAQYYASQPPPARPAPANVVRAPATPAPARSGTTASSRSPATGGGTVGTEQGAATTGGTQGQGGTDQGSRVDHPAPAKGR